MVYNKLNIPDYYIERAIKLAYGVAVKNKPVKSAEDFNHAIEYLKTTVLKLTDVKNTEELCLWNSYVCNDLYKILKYTLSRKKIEDWIQNLVFYIYEYNVIPLSENIICGIKEKTVCSLL